MNRSSEHESQTPGIERSEQRSTFRHHVNDATVRTFATDAARLIADSHGEDIVLLDVRQMSDISDYILIASGTSDRQMRSVADDIEELAQERGLERFGGERDDATTWIVLDFVDVIVHLFEPNTRAHYDLEMLWGDAPRIDWRRS